MEQHESEVRASKALGKGTNFFFIPEQYVYPFAMITGGIVIFHLVISTFFPLNSWIMIGIWLTLVLAYSLFYGKQPWKLGGEFHRPTNWILGYIQFDSNKKGFRTKSKSNRKRLGYGKSQREATVFENKLHLSCLVEIHRGLNQIGAYLLEKGGKYRLIFVFEFLGIRSNLDPTIIEATLDKIKEGLKDLPSGESLVFRCGNFTSNRSISRELSTLKNINPNRRIKYLLKALQISFDKLLQQGNFNENPCYIECSYTLDSTAIKGRDFIEQILAGLQDFSSSLGGKKAKVERENLQALLNKAYQEGFIFWRDFLETTIGLDTLIYPLNGTQIYQRDFAKYNDFDDDKNPEEDIIPDKPPQLIVSKRKKLEIVVNSQYHLTTDIFYVGSPDADKQWVYLPGKKAYVGGAVYHKQPEKWKGFKRQLEYGSACINNPAIVNTEIVVELTLPNQEYLQFKTQRRTKDSNSSRTHAEKRNVLDVGSNYNIKQNVALEEDFLDGMVAVSVGWVILVYRKTPESLRIGLNRVQSLFRKPALVKRESEYFDEIWLSTLPFYWQDILAEYNRRILYRTEAATCLLPLNFDRTKAKRGLCFISDRSRTPLYIDPYTSPQHTAILGTTGSGKSVLFDGIITTGLAYDLDVTLVDKTRGDGTGTFDTITNFVGGAYFNTVRESNNLFENVNPDEISDREKREAADGIFRRFLKKALISLIIDENENREKVRNYKWVVTSSLQRFFREPEIINRYETAHRSGIGTRAWQDIPTMKHFLDFLPIEDSSEQIPEKYLNAAREIKYQLGVIIDSSLGKIIAAPSTFDNNSKLVVYGIGDVDDEQMTPIALSAYAAAIRKSFRSTKSLFCMDEASNLGSNFDFYGEVLRSFCSRGRKEGVSVIYAGQDLDSIEGLPNSAQILDNTHNYLIGKIKPSALELLEKELEIPRNVARENTLDTFGRKGNSTSWLVKSGSALSFAHYYPSPQQLCLIKNEPAFAELRKEYFQKYKNPYEAIAKLIPKMDAA